MPIMKCHDCHHEWEGNRKKCDWCSSAKEAIVLEEKSQFEKFVESLADGAVRHRKILIRSTKSVQN